VNWLYSGLLSFLMMSLVMFVSTLVTVVEKQCWSLGKQQIGIQILGNLHNLILLKKCQVKTWNYLCWAHFMDGPWIMIKSVQCVQQCTRVG